MTAYWVLALTVGTAIARPQVGPIRVQPHTAAVAGALAMVALGLLAFVVIVLGLAAARWVHSRGIVREAQAQAALREASARAYAIEMQAFNGATRIQVVGGKVLVIF